MIIVPQCEHEVLKVSISPALFQLPRVAQIDSAQSCSSSRIHNELIVKVKCATVGFEVVDQLVNSHWAVLEEFMASLSIKLPWINSMVRHQVLSRPTRIFSDSLNSYYLFLTGNDVDWPSNCPPPSFQRSLIVDIRPLRRSRYTPHPLLQVRRGTLAWGEPWHRGYALQCADACPHLLQNHGKTHDMP